MNKFAGFLKAYMGTAPAVVAAITIPVTAFGVIPVLDFQKNILTVYSSLFSFFVVAIIFYRRHRIASYMLPGEWEKRSRLVGRFMMSWLPVICFAVSALAAICYYAQLTGLVTRMAGPEMSLDAALKAIRLKSVTVEMQTTLLVLYVLIFMAASTGFALMAIREYMQGELGLSETQLVKNVKDPFVKQKTGD